MSFPARSLLESVLTHRRAVVVLWLVLAALAAPGLTRLGTDNSAEVFFVRDTERLERYRRFQMDFGRDRTVRGVVSGPGLRSREGLAWLGELEERAGAVRGVYGAAGLWTHHRNDPDLRSESWPPRDPTAFWERVRSDPLDRAAGFVAGPAEGRSEGGSEGRGETATFLVALYNLPRERQERTLRELEELVAAIPPGLEPKLETSLVGLPLVERAMDREMISFALRFFPWLAVVAVALLAAVFRRPAEVLLPLTPTAVCLTLIFGLRGGIGRPINLVEIVLTPLLFVIALATALHVQMRFRELRRRGDRDVLETVLATYREKGWPVLWTGLTTMAGFGSLAVSEVPPVRSLGLWTALGLGLITLAMLTLFPALLAMSRREGARLASADVGVYDRWAAARGRIWAAAAVGRRGRTVLGFALLAAVAAAGVARIEPDTDVLGYLPAEDPARAELVWLEETGIGAVTAELVLESTEDASPDAGPFTRRERLEALGELSAELRREPGVLSAIGAGEVLASAGSFEALTARPELDLLLRSLRTDDGRQARIAVFLPMQGVEELEPVLARLREIAEAAFPEARVHLTGRFPLVLAAQDRLLTTMLTSLSLTFTVVAAIFLALFRRLRLTGVALVPNLWPVLCIVGVMGWSGVPLDGTTVMIASVVLGLAVDDTLHTLGRYRHEGTGDPVSTLEHTAPAHVLTTALLSAGFGVCAFSAFLPISRFGALTVLALGLALAADLLLVPALLAGGPPPTPPRGAGAASASRRPAAGSPAARERLR